jgi:phage terminase large subunit-like protein
VRPDEHAYFDLSLFDQGLMPEPDLTKYECTGGFDGSQTTDPSSFSLCWHLGNRNYYIKNWSWIAKEGVEKREKTSLPKYQQFASQNAMTITDGDRIDDMLIFKFIMEKAKKYKVKSISFDPTSAMIMMGWIENQGIKVYRVTQSCINYNSPMKEFAKALVEKRIKHDGNTWLRHCLNMVRIKEDEQGRIAPSTKRRIDHDDAAISTLLSFASMMIVPTAETKKQSIYNKRPVITI